MGQKVKVTAGRRSMHELIISLRTSLECRAVITKKNYKQLENMVSRIDMQVRAIRLRKPSRSHGC